MDGSLTIAGIQQLIRFGFIPTALLDLLVPYPLTLLLIGSPLLISKTSLPFGFLTHLSV